MEYLDIIQSSIDYIEENLKADVTAQELADKSGFSLFHYYRLFQSAVGMPVMQYITRRKLLHGIYEISCKKKYVDIALDYGFDTYAGFYKAIKREFGYTPQQFLENRKINKPYRIKLGKEACIMVTHKKVSEILKSWRMENEEIRDIFYDSGERNEHAFYIGDDYVMKIFANLGNLKSHVEISKSLENIGLSAATPVKTVTGNKIVEDGELYFILTKRIKGERMKTADMYEGDYAKKARFVGEIIGQLSVALKKVEAVANDKNLYKTVTAWALPKTKTLLNIPEDICDGVVNTLGQLYDKLPKQIIHRDPNPSNIIAAGDSWGFIDFELSERNIRIFDPCYAATAILSESFDEKDSKKLSAWIEIYRNIIYGYDSVARLSNEEMQAIPYVVLSNQLICCAWFFGQEKYSAVYDANVKMTGWLCENFGKLAIE